MRVSVVRLLLLVACSCSLASAITMLSPEFSVRRVIPGNQMQAITFTPNGDLYMAWGTTKTYCKYPNAVNLPIGATLSSANATCGTGPVASINFVSSQTGRIYDTRGWEIDKNTWAATKRWDDCGASHGIAIDPRDGAIFVSSALTGLVWRIPNPDNYQGVYATDCTNDLYFNVSAAGYKAVDGITIGPDGTFYGAGTNNHLLIISPWSAAAPQGTLIAAKPTMVTTPDGISICVNNGNSFALVAMNSGQGFISRFNLSGLGGAPTYAETVIANNVGGYLDFSAVDPKGCIWGTTIFSGGQGTYRVTNADGTCTCASAQVPTPQNPSCPNCSDVHHVTYAGDSDFSANFHSDGKCSSITFD